MLLVFGDLVITARAKRGQRLGRLCGLCVLRERGT
jgi:hypothetical protein